MILPDLSFENELWQAGFKVVAGADEVGRGSFAGPVVAASVVFDPKIDLPKGVRINDSKKLTPRQREKASEWIKNKAQAWGVGQASVRSINRFGMSQATRKAFRQAIARVYENLAIDFLLIDAFYLPYVKGLQRKNQRAIVKGDEKSVSIAAASIIAKVYRDQIMTKLGQRYQAYGWEANKGYGTQFHRQAILKHGITCHHRRSFVNKYLKK